MRARQTYSVSATAARLGVAPATLRTWARRHGMEPSGHATGAHRRYTERDLLKLMTMRTLISRGALVSEAARVVSTMNFDDVTLAEVETQMTDALAGGTPHRLANQADSSDNPVVATETAHVSAVDTQDASGGEGLTRGESATGSQGGPGSDFPGKAKAATLGQQNDPPQHASEDRTNVAVLRLAPTPPLDEHLHQDDDYKTRCTTLVSAALKDELDICASLLAVRQDESLVDWWKLLVKPALDRISNHTVLATPGKTPRLLLGYLAQRAIADRMAVVRPDIVANERPHPSRLKNITLVFAPEGDDLAIPAHVLTGALLENGCNAHVILGPENERRVSELVRIVRPSVVAFVSHQVAPDLDLLKHVAGSFPELPMFVWLREGEDIGDLRALPQVVSMSSFRAMFHEIYGSVRSLDPSDEYWPEDQAEYLSK